MGICSSCPPPNTLSIFGLCNLIILYYLWFYTAMAAYTNARGYTFRVIHHSVLARPPYLPHNLAARQRLLLHTPPSNEVSHTDLVVVSLDRSACTVWFWVKRYILHILQTSIVCCCMLSSGIYHPPLYTPTAQLGVRISPVEHSSYRALDISLFSRLRYLQFHLVSSVYCRDLLYGIVQSHRHKLRLHPVTHSLFRLYERIVHSLTWGSPYCEGSPPPIGWLEVMPMTLVIIHSVEIL